MGKYLFRAWAFAARLFRSGLLGGVTTAAPPTVTHRATWARPTRTATWTRPTRAADWSRPTRAGSWSAPY